MGDRVHHAPTAASPRPGKRRQQSLALTYPPGRGLMPRHHPADMFYILLSLGVLSLIGVVLMLRASHHAPEGQEDEHGYRQTPPPTRSHEVRRPQPGGERPAEGPVVPAAREVSSDNG